MKDSELERVLREARRMEDVRRRVLGRVPDLLAAEQRLRDRSGMQVVESMTLGDFLMDSVLPPEVRSAFERARMVASAIGQVVVDLGSKARTLRSAIDELPTPAILRIIEALQEDENLLGIVELDEDAGSIDTSALAAELPPEAISRLVEVRFVPLLDARAIARNPDLLGDLSPRTFEELTAYLLDNLGYENVELTPPSNDGGCDVVATKRVDGIPLLFLFECKRYRSDRGIGPGTLRALLGTVERRRANVGVLVTTSFFTRGSREFIVTEPRIDGKDLDDLVEWIARVPRPER